MIFPGEDRSHAVERNVTPPAVLDGVETGAWEKVGGIPLIVRTLYHLNEALVPRVVILCRNGNIPMDLRRWGRDVALEVMQVEKNVADSMLSIANLGSHLIYIDGSHLMVPG